MQIIGFTTNIYDILLWLMVVPCPFLHHDTPCRTMSPMSHHNAHCRTMILLILCPSCRTIMSLVVPWSPLGSCSRWAWPSWRWGSRSLSPAPSLTCHPTFCFLGYYLIKRYVFTAPAKEGYFGQYTLMWNAANFFGTYGLYTSKNNIYRRVFNNQTQLTSNIS